MHRYCVLSLDSLSYLRPIVGNLIFWWLLVGSRGKCLKSLNKKPCDVMSVNSMLIFTKVAGLFTPKDTKGTRKSKHPFMRPQSKPFIHCLKIFSVSPLPLPALFGKVVSDFIHITQITKVQILITERLIYVHNKTYVKTTAVLLLGSPHCSHHTPHRATERQSLQLE